ncbi:hypothetical protein BDW02DRAFT_359632 [Decorospora gaudefroyi]|uniref:Heterokaryon incompatibility domain-containing protein n=1 Tax=Decorospora gaudefroyi TaxID=184978 RepID=A0A6A5KHD1_9PLEO|nr:hypothetical protein BDW02DRAFT_359632 [Decorospora gaudefroyi]
MIYRKLRKLYRACLSSSAESSNKDAVLHHTSGPNNCNALHHQPLDCSVPSIRLLQVLPSLSPDGRIQCIITHISVDTVYTCLSYRWGDPSPSCVILINGKSFKIRQNLFNFLTVVRATAASGTSEFLGPYWVDALCIDQANVLEHNHQVAQMGKIYSNAAHVYLWLGLMPPSIFPLLRVIKSVQDSRRASARERIFVCSNDELLDEYIFNNEYWSRAWVVQEVFIGSQVMVWLDAEPMSLKQMTEGLEHFLLMGPGTRVPGPFSEFDRAWKEDFKGSESLIPLLERFHDKQCSDPRDRVFSLLSLVSGEGSKLEVNYDIPLIDLTVEVLRHCSSSVCFCTAV